MTDDPLGMSPTTLRRLRDASTARLFAGQRAELDAALARLPRWARWLIGGRK